MSEPAASPDTTGLDPKLAGLLCYLLPPVTGIVFYLIEKKDPIVRWHAAQSIVFGVAWIFVWVAFMVLSTVLSAVPLLGWIASALLWIVIALGGFVLWVVCLIKGYSGQPWRMPLLAQFADRVVAGPAQA